MIVFCKFKKYVSLIFHKKLPIFLQKSYLNKLRKQMCGRISLNQNYHQVVAQLLSGSSSGGSFLRRAREEGAAGQGAPPRGGFFGSGGG